MPWLSSAARMEAAASGRRGLLSTGGPEKKTAVLDASHPVGRHPTTALISAVTSPTIEYCLTPWRLLGGQDGAAIDAPR